MYVLIIIAITTITTSGNSSSGSCSTAGVFRPGVCAGRAERAKCEERGILVAEITERARDPANRPLVLLLLLRLLMLFLP